MPYLLAAEADKIQDFIFRSSRLREVVGASQLLTRFCRSVEGENTLAKDHQYEVVVNDGGSFRVIFDTREQAIAFGADLAELYRLALGGSLTVAEPVELNGDFREANKTASNRLRWAKSRRQGVIAEVHMPYVAFCESCGVALASAHTRLAKERGEEPERYICDDCSRKAYESATNRTELLEEFLKEVIEDESQLSRYEFLYEPEKVGRYDRRNYVAYLVADGNGMGALLGELPNETALRQFSEGISTVARRSLAKATKKIKVQIDALRPEDATTVPVLPLILGGDDLFALIPAPYALDFARQFCLAWEEQMRNLVERVGLTDVSPPTIAAAVVICKSTYPYSLAHQRAEMLLKESKRQSKLLAAERVEHSTSGAGQSGATLQSELLAAERGKHFSAVNFEVILGNRLAGLDNGDKDRQILPTLRPYWVAKEGLSADAQERGIDLRILLAQRLALKDLPNKRLAELRRCFEDVPSDPSDVSVYNRTQKLDDWTKHRLERILKRLSASSQSRVEDALAKLGEPRKNGDGNHHWREIRRGADSLPLAHGMLDLLEAWDFAQELDKSPDEYEPQEEEA